MKRLTLMLLVAFAFCLTSFNAYAGKPPTQEARERLEASIHVCEGLRAGHADEQQIAQRGCCSWHSGVCGCSRGRVTCCDGTTSPSCTCNSEDPPSSDT